LEGANIVQDRVMEELGIQKARFLRKVNDEMFLQRDTAVGETNRAHWN
jgi:hypothetical protein